jgi:hypothetical protein
MLIGLFCAAVAVLVFWPETGCGRFLRRGLVDAPARMFARLTPGGVLFALFVVLAIGAVIGLAKTDAVFVLAQGAPEGIAWLVTFDVATYLDLIAVAWLLAAAVRLRSAYEALRAVIVRANCLARPWIRMLCLRGATGARSRSRRRGHRAPPPPREREWAWLAFAPSYA